MTDYKKSAIIKTNQQLSYSQEFLAKKCDDKFADLLTPIYNFRLF